MEEIGVIAASLEIGSTAGEGQSVAKGSNPTQTTAEQWFTGDQHPVAVLLARIAHNGADSIRLGLRETVIAETSKAALVRNVRISGPSWGDINSFVNRFWFDYLEGECQPEDSRVVSVSSRGVDFLLARDDAEPIIGHHLWAHESKAGLQHQPFFYLLDVAQSGSTMSFVDRSAILKAIEAECSLIWVLGNIHEVIASGEAQLAETVWWLRSFFGTFQFAHQGILVDHEDPALTALFWELALGVRMENPGAALDLGIARGLDAINALFGSLAINWSRVVREYENLETQGKNYD